MDDQYKLNPTEEKLADEFLDKLVPYSEAEEFQKLKEQNSVFWDEEDLDLLLRPEYKAWLKHRHD